MHILFGARMTRGSLASVLLLGCSGRRSGARDACLLGMEALDRRLGDRGTGTIFGLLMSVLGEQRDRGLFAAPHVVGGADIVSLQPNYLLSCAAYLPLVLE